MNCRRCWRSDDEVQLSGNFKLVHDPGHWGSSDPRTLVLGISKGNTQSSAFHSESFDEVAFRGIRSRILEIFQSVGLLKNETITTFNKRFTKDEKDFSFASVVRCSMTGMDRKKRFYTADSPNVLPAFRANSDGYKFVENCVDQHLTNLSPTLTTILLLGNTDAYISALKGVVAAKRGAVVPINEVGYWSDGVRFVHLAHPSKGNGHFGAYVRGEGASGVKRDLAKLALMSAQPL